MALGVVRKIAEALARLVLASLFVLLLTGVLIGLLGLLLMQWLRSPWARWAGRMEKWR